MATGRSLGAVPASADSDVGPRDAVPMASRLYRWHLGRAWRAAPEAALRRRLAGRSVLLTGASSGVGWATALALGRCGAHVIGLARREAALSRLDTTLRRSGATATMITCDLTDPAQVDEVADRLADRPLDIMINNAAVSLHRRVDRAVDPVADLERSVATNFTGPARLTTRVLPSLAGGGHLLLVGSVSALVPTAGWAAYASSKAGIDAWGRAVAAELRPYRTGVTTVHLPLVLTPMSAPTYRTGWGLTADQAASVLLATLVRRPRLLAPWWARLAGATGLVAPQVVERATGGPRASRGAR